MNFYTAKEQWMNSEGKDEEYSWTAIPNTTMSEPVFSYWKTASNLEGKFRVLRN
jgi:hypothetical protein